MVIKALLLGKYYIATVFLVNFSELNFSFQRFCLSIVYLF